MDRQETIEFFARVERLIDSLNRVDFPEDYENEGERKEKKNEKEKKKKKKNDSRMEDEEEGDFFEEAIEKNGDVFNNPPPLSLDFSQRLESNVSNFYTKVRKKEARRIKVVRCSQKYISTPEDRVKGIFWGCRFFFVKDRHLSKKSIDRIKERTKERDASFVEDPRKSTHIVTNSDSFESIVRLHAGRHNLSASRVCDIFRKKKVVKVDWIQESIKDNRRREWKEYGLVKVKVLDNVEPSEEKDVDMKEKEASSRYINNTSHENPAHNFENLPNQNNENQHGEKRNFRRKWKKFNIEDRKEKFFAGKPVGTEIEKPCINQDIVDKLMSMKENYGTVGDHWRNYSYGKAIAIIKNLKYRITSGDQAKKIRGIGDGIAQKIHQFLTMGKIPKLEFLENDPKSKFIAELSSTHGIGRQTALDMWARGYRDVDKARKEGDWNKNQLIGIRYMDDLAQRIPRKEVEEIGNFVIKEAKRISPTVMCTICGSYRRGAADCGDVDVLICDNDGTLPRDRKRDGYLKKLVSRLEYLGLIIETLNSSRRKKEDGKESETFMGVCRLSHRGSLARRLDIKVYARECYPHALLYFTGCDRYNRSMRLYARKKGFSMSDKGIMKVIRNPRKPSEILTELEMIKGLNTERDVVEFLGLPWKEPHQRNHDVSTGMASNKKMRKDMF